MESLQNKGRVGQGAEAGAARFPKGKLNSCLKIVNLLQSGANWGFCDYVYQTKFVLDMGRRDNHLRGVVPLYQKMSILH